MKEARQILEQVLKMNGIRVSYLDETRSFTDSLKSISDSIDSLSYISILVQIEEIIGTSFPDEVLSKNMFACPDELLRVIDSMITQE